MAKALNVVGLMNVQFAIQNIDGKDVIYVLEVNPRASRTVPFVSQGDRHSAGQGGGALHGRPVAGFAGHHQDEVTPPYFSVKEAVFPFVKFPGVDTILGPEMKSTGEVMGVGKTFRRSFCEVPTRCAGTKLPTLRQGLFLTVKNKRQTTCRGSRTQAGLYGLEV